LIPTSSSDRVGLRKLWVEQHPTALGLHSHLKRIFSMAIANGYYRGDNPAAWRDHLEHILPRSKDVHRAEHHSWVPYQDIGRFMAKLRAWEDQSARRTDHTTVALLRIRGLDRRAPLRGTVSAQSKRERARPLHQTGPVEADIDGPEIPQRSGLLPHDCLC
jgi:hypothetical protein